MWYSWLLIHNFKILAEKCLLFETISQTNDIHKLYEQKEISKNLLTWNCVLSYIVVFHDLRLRKKVLELPRQEDDLGCVRLIVFRNRNKQKFVTNLFDREFVDHWNVTFILITTFLTRFLYLIIQLKPKQVLFRVYSRHYYCGIRSLERALSSSLSTSR